MGLLSAIRKSPFLDGMARLMDFEGVLVKQDEDEGFEADARNLYRDWEQVGGHMRKAMNQIDHEIEASGLKGRQPKRPSGPSRRTSAQGLAASPHEEIRLGPLPAPDAYQAYEDALPGAADRILALAEREQERRLAMDQMEGRTSLAGLVLGFTLPALSVGGGVWAMYLGRDVQVSLGMSCLGLIAATLGTILRWRSLTTGPPTPSPRMSRSGK